MSEKHIQFDINDARSAKIAEAISNKTCKKILNILAEKELSEKDLSLQLKLPINTVEYNLKKLISAGLIEKSHDFFWSIKGKRIPLYRIADKTIIISPKSSFKPGIISGIMAAFIFGAAKIYFNNKNQIQEDAVLASKMGETLSYSQPSFFQGIGTWIIMGFLLGLLVFSLYKLLKGGQYGNKR